MIDDPHLVALLDEITFAKKAAPVGSEAVDRYLRTAYDAYMADDTLDMVLAAQALMHFRTATRPIGTLLS